MWPTMLIYITAQMLRTFHFSFPLLRHHPPSYSFNYCFIFSLHFVGCACSFNLAWQTIYRISTGSKKIFFVMRAKSLFPIHLHFLQTEAYLDPTQRSMMEFFFKKISNVWKLGFPQKSPSYMFDRVLNTPLVSSLVFSLLGRFVKQNYWRGI